MPDFLDDIISNASEKGTKNIMMQKMLRNIKSYLYKYRSAQYAEQKVEVPNIDIDRNKKRLSLFLHYNCEENISTSDWKYLEALDKISDVFIVSNSIINPNTKKIIKDKDWMLYERGNTGYDFGGWKEAITLFRNHIEKYDILVLVNNSCFFPVYPLEGVFAQMEVKNVDFWGITAFKENPLRGSLEAQILKTDRVPTHVQSYFIVFDLKRTGDCFFNFWDNYSEQNSFSNTVKYGEIGITEFLLNHGKKYEVFVNETLDDLDYYLSPDLSKNQPERLLAMGCPLIKKKALTQITIKQYYILLIELRKLNVDLYDEVKKVDYRNNVSKTYRYMNKIVSTSGGLNKLKKNIT